MPIFIFLFAAAYIIGSINFSIGILKLAGRKDPRKSYSKNAGATNVYRQEGLFFAALVLLFDMGRALVVAAAALKFLPVSLVPWIGLGLILGNRFPVFHRFNGGKGVANYLGFTIMLAPIMTALGIMAWAIVFYIWRTPFLSSFALITFLSVGNIILVGPDLSGITGVISTFVFIVCCHHSNITGWFRMRAS